MRYDTYPDFEKRRTKRRKFVDNFQECQLRFFFSPHSALVVVLNDMLQEIAVTHNFQIAFTKNCLANRFFFATHSSLAVSLQIGLQRYH